MSIGPYNGWTGEERMATLPIQRAAVRSGLLAKPSRCSICQFVNADDPTGRNYVTFHSERYDRPLEVYETCYRDHGRLHMRFDRPGPWLRLVAEHGTNGTKWFEMLTMDPASLSRPFHQTYPRGLPRPE